ncbi:hypothetical protein [Paraburkholderia sp. D1E]|uniref:hypothetical protein n=1 Tax=Paraburkholderia sp. D1E TaxID=3461398 RepID=UPI00404611D2
MIDAGGGRHTRAICAWQIRVQLLNQFIIEQCDNDGVKIRDLLLHIERGVGL